MNKNFLIGGIISVLGLGTCSLPFLPMSKETHLAGLYKSVSVGSYEIDLRIGLRENQKKNNMEGFGYFTYSEEDLSKDGCLIKVSVEVEGYTGSDRSLLSPHGTGENLYCFSTDESCTYKNEFEGRLSLYFYNAPITQQSYTLRLESKTGVKNSKCTATKNITHEIKYRRSSWWQRAMSV